jgi:hypothetical protein
VGDRWRPTWVYASDALSAPMALLVKALTGRRVITTSTIPLRRRHARRGRASCVWRARADGCGPWRTSACCRTGPC